MKKFGFLVILLFVFRVVNTSAQECVECHKKQTPNIVSDWQLSLHSQNEIGCSVCHGDQHKDPYDVDKVQIPTPETCANCHEDVKNHDVVEVRNEFNMGWCIDCHRKPEMAAPIDCVVCHR